MILTYSNIPLVPLQGGAEQLQCGLWDSRSSRGEILTIPPILTRSPTCSADTSPQDPREGWSRDSSTFCWATGQARLPGGAIPNGLLLYLWSNVYNKAPRGQLFIFHLLAWTKHH